MTVGDYLALIGQLAIGVAGFSGVVAALTTRSAHGWRQVDVLRLQMLLESSISAAMWAVVPALLLSSGLTGPVLWRAISGSWLILAAPMYYLRARRVRALLAEDPEDTSRRLVVFMISGALASFLLQGANVLLVAAPWPYLTSLAWSLLVALVLFLRLASVAFTAGRSAA